MEDPIKSVSWQNGQIVCRCCLAEGCYKDIGNEYFWMGKREVYEEMLSATFDLKISYGSTGGLTRPICEACISRLRDASEFKRQVLECEKMFIQQLEPGTSSSGVDIQISPERTLKEVKIEGIVKVEKLEDSDDDGDGDVVFEDLPGADDDESMDDEPLMKFATKEPKKEKDLKKEKELMKLLTGAGTSVVKRKTTTITTKASPAKRAKTEKPTPSSTKKIITIKRNPPPKAPAPKKKETEKKKDNNAQPRFNELQRNAMLILRNSTAYPFRTVSGKLIRCFFCLEAFDDPAMFRSHVESVHAGVDRAIAVFRNLNVPRVDVSELRCALCSEKHQTLESIAVHLKKEHSIAIKGNYDFSLVPIKLDKNMCKCFVCDAKFPALVTLCKHAAAHYTATCMVCDQCGAPFENEHCLRKHLLSRHQIWCRICRQTFMTREELSKHVKSSPECLPSKCRICKRRFSCFEILSSHYVKVHKMVAQTVKCGECSEVFWNQKSYYRHFKSRHTDDFKCSYCQRGFSTRRDLEEHLPKHTGVKPHQCAACGKCYTTHKGFKDHLLSHEQGSGRYQCPVAECKRNFPLRERMLAHLKKYHKDIYDKVAAEENL